MVSGELFRRASPESLAWLRERIEVAINAGREVERIEAACDLFVELQAQTQLEPVDCLPADYQPPGVPVAPSVLRAMDDAGRNYRKEP